MQKQLNTWKFIAASLENKIPVMLLFVLESRGSSPGRQGFFMAVNAEGKMEGSIGGGIMEYKFVELAKEKLRVPGGVIREGQLYQQVHDKSAPANQSGMICSGEQTIFIHRVKYTELKSVDLLVNSLEENSNGSLSLSPSGIFFSRTIPPQNYDFSMVSENEWAYVEKTGYKNQLFIIGGGHCALAFSKLMREMDFYITVLEERRGLNTLEQNEYAHEILLIDDYSALGNLIPSGPSQYVVIMTAGYRTDDMAIRSLRGKSFKYFGVLGSKKKIEKMFDDYTREGIAEEDLKKIIAPVGIPIGSQTPEEIAVSIAAQIIKVKSLG